LSYPILQAQHSNKGDSRLANVAGNRTVGLAKLKEVMNMKDPKDKFLLGGLLIALLDEDMDEDMEDEDEDEDYEEEEDE
jgi:hypothetical protein